MLFIPKTTQNRPAISAEKTEPLPHPKKSATWWDPSFTRPQDLPDDQAVLYGERPGWFIPSYDELSLFLMAVTLILLYAANAPLRDDIHKLIMESHDVRVYAIAVVFLCGMGLSIYHIFTTREKTGFEKNMMLFFAVLANAVTGIIAGVFVLRQAAVGDWLLIFPVWNIINGVLLLVMLRCRIIDEECISDRDATASQVVVGLATLFIVFVFCNYVFQLYWAITFSICIVYVTSFERALQSIFPALADREDEQAD
jgi:hypothetical protein